MPCTLTLLGFHRVAETLVIEFNLLVLLLELLLEALYVCLKGLLALLVLTLQG